jgi:hypothetical protein
MQDWLIEPADGEDCGPRLAAPAGHVSDWLQRDRVVLEAMPNSWESPDFLRDISSEKDLHAIQVTCLCAGVSRKLIDRLRAENAALAAERDSLADQCEEQ